MQNSDTIFCSDIAILKISDCCVMAAGWLKADIISRPAVSAVTDLYGEINQ